MNWEIILKFLLFGLCLFIAYQLLGFQAKWVAVCLGVYQFGSSWFDIGKRKELIKTHIREVQRINLDNANALSEEKKKRIAFKKQIIKDNNRTINKLVTLINSTFSELKIEQQKDLLESLVSEIDQQINYTQSLCDQYLTEIEAKKCIKPLNDFKWSIVKRIQGKRARKGIKFDSLLNELQNLEDKINV